MKRDGQATEVVNEPDQSDQLMASQSESELRKAWRSIDVFCAVVLAVILFAAIWVGISSGIDYVHVGRSECSFSHDRFSQMDVQCGTEPVGNSGVPSSNTGAPLANTGASIDNPTTP